MSKPQWVHTDEDEELWGKAVGMSISDELLQYKMATKGYVDWKSAQGSLVLFSLVFRNVEIDLF